MDKSTLFRTIVTLLTRIPDVKYKLVQHLELNDSEVQSAADRTQLRILGALALVLVRDHEVVAVATNNDWKNGVHFWIAANPRERATLTTSDPTDALTYGGDGELQFMSVNSESETSLDPFDLHNPFPYLQRTWYAHNQECYILITQF